MASSAYADPGTISLAERLSREERLRAAVLIDAIRCLQHRGRRRLRQRVISWITARNDTSPFSFVEVCDALQLSAARVRRAMLALDATGERDCAAIVASIEDPDRTVPARWRVADALQRLPDLRRPSVLSPGWRMKNKPDDVDQAS